jgi:micrococcal nuclease
MKHDFDFHRARARRSSPGRIVPFRVRRSPTRYPSAGWARDVATMTAIGVALGLAIAMPDRAARMLGAAAATADRLKAEGRALVTPRAAGTPMAARHFGLCFTGGGTNCVVDGDTFWIDGEKVRVADIDAPETHPPRCAREARLGDAATERLKALLNAGPATLVPIDRDTDRYGRKLRVVERDGRSLGGMLVREGLAREWGGRREPWC